MALAVRSGEPATGQVQFRVAVFGSPAKAVGLQILRAPPAAVFGFGSNAVVAPAAIVPMD